VDVGCVASVSEEPAGSIFRIEVALDVGKKN
jgi:hypothetical protein